MLDIAQIRYMYTETDLYYFIVLPLTLHSGEFDEQQTPISTTHSPLKYIYKALKHSNEKCALNCVQTRSSISANSSSSNSKGFQCTLWILRENHKSNVCDYWFCLLHCTEMMMILLLLSAWQNRSGQQFDVHFRLWIIHGRSWSQCGRAIASRKLQLHLFARQKGRNNIATETWNMHWNAWCGPASPRCGVYFVLLLPKWRQQSLGCRKDQRHAHM